MPRTETATAYQSHFPPIDDTPALVCFSAPRINAERVEAMAEHVVSQGDTLGGIAARYGTSVRAVAAANQLRDADFIRVGQRLRLPDGVRGAAVSRAAPAPARAVPLPSPPRGVPGREGSTNRYVAKLMEFGDRQARADFDAGKRVVVAIRVVTNHREHLNGRFDDKIAVLQKAPDGVVRVREFDGNTEPSGIYSHGNQRAHKGSSIDMNKDKKMDTGRLVLGCYRYRKREKPFLKRVAFRATRTQVAERDTNQDGSFDKRDSNRIDRTGAHQSMLIHIGGEGSTGSAGCQTIKKSQYSSFLTAISITTQSEFSYVLVR